jgi:peptidoglycan/LPS O-acetylase OafA/YrhL
MALSIDNSTRPREARNVTAGMSRIQSLDGIRAVAILLVIACHCFRGGVFVATLGDLGVRLFFVLSGFLITTILLAEQGKYGRISLRRFYWRRFLRICPAYWFFLAFAVGVSILGGAGIARGDLAAGLLYVANYRSLPWMIAYTWSLSVEEQFYALWPVLLVVAGVARTSQRAFVPLAIAPVVRFYWFAETGPEAFGFVSNADALAPGCLLAMWRSRLWSVAGRVIESRLFAFACIGVVVAVESLAASVPVLEVSIGRTVIALAFAALIDHAMRRPPQILNLTPAAYLGRISYSLYLFQQGRTTCRTRLSRSCCWDSRLRSLSLRVT